MKDDTRQVSMSELQEAVHLSHASIAKNYSDAFGEIKSDIRSLKEAMDYIKEDNTRRNGSFTKAVDRFVSKFDEQDVINDSLKMWKYTSAGGIAVIVLVILPILGWAGIELIHLIEITNSLPK